MDERFLSISSVDRVFDGKQRSRASSSTSARASSSASSVRAAVARRPSFGSSRALTSRTPASVVPEGRDITDLPANRRPVNLVFQRVTFVPAPERSRERSLRFAPARDAVARSGSGRLTLPRARSVAGLRGPRCSHAVGWRGSARRAGARPRERTERVLLLDEPLAALDLQIRRQIQTELKDIHKTLGITFIYVTHDQEEAMRMSDRVVIMSEGSIEQVGSPREVYARPASAFAAGFIGTSNLWEATIVEAGAEGVVLDVAGTPDPRQPCGWRSSWFHGVAPAAPRSALPRAGRSIDRTAWRVASWTGHRCQLPRRCRPLPCRAWPTGSCWSADPWSTAGPCQRGRGGSGELGSRSCDSAVTMTRVEQDLSRFEGRVAIVTGGSSGIGLAAGKRLASEGASLCLVAAPADREPLEAALAHFDSLGSAAVGFAEDIGLPETSDHAVSLALQTFGRLDYLVNNAGIGPAGEVFDTTIEEYDRIMHVNVRGMLLAAMASARAMAAADEGGRAMVCTASTASFMGEERQLAYNISKGAVMQLTRSLGVALAPYDIRVNAVAPGYVRTERMSAGLADAAQWSQARARIPADRPAETDEIASVIAFLLSRDASYMTGATVVVDGGHTAGWRNTDWEAVEVQDIEQRARRRLGSEA